MMPKIIYIPTYRYNYIPNIAIEQFEVWLNQEQSPLKVILQTNVVKGLRNT